MRIGIISQWYEPEPGPAALPGVMARALVARGHDVYVLTGFPNYPSGRVAAGYRQKLRLAQELGGVKVIRTPLFPSHDGSTIHRMANYLSFALSASVLGVPFFPALDVLWVNYSPVTVALPMWLQQLLKRTPAVCEVADLWPDTLEVSGIRATRGMLSLGGNWLDRWCNRIYSSSEAIVYISPGVGHALESRGVPRDKLNYIPKPADEQMFHDHGTSLRGELGIQDDAVVLLYGGSMGAAQGLEALIEACSLVDDPRFVMLMAGSGLRESELRELAAEKSADNVRFLGRLPQSSMSDLLATADAAFISLGEHPLSEITMPSKTQVALAAGRPILVAGAGDVARIAKDHAVGFTADPGVPSSIAQAIRQLLSTGREGLASMGAAARRLYESEFSVERTTAQIENLLVEVASSAGHARRSGGFWHV